MVEREQRSDSQSWPKRGTGNEASEEFDNPEIPLDLPEGSGTGAGELPPPPALGASESASTAPKKSRKKWPWIVGVPVALVLLLAVVGAIVGPAKKHSPSTTTTTAANSAVSGNSGQSSDSGILNGAFNINANWAPASPTPPSTAWFCSGTGPDAPFTKGSTVYISTVQGQQGTQMVPLGDGIMDAASNQNLPGIAEAGYGGGPYICQTDIDVKGLSPASTYYLTIVSTSGQSTAQFSMPQQTNANAAPPEITVDPNTTSEPTTTTAPPSVVLKVTGTGPASTITIDAGGNETQQNDQPLPWTESLPEVPDETVLGAQSSNGSASTSITCEIDYPNQAPVVQTSTGPYADVECSASSNS